MGLYKGYIGFILGLYWDIGFYRGYIGFCWGYIRIVENRMETTKV